MKITKTFKFFEDFIYFIYKSIFLHLKFKILQIYWKNLYIIDFYLY